MPQLIFYALVAAGAYMGVKWIKREGAKLKRAAAQRPAKAAPRQTRAQRPVDPEITTLEQDPKTGVYKPTDE